MVVKRDFDKVLVNLLRKDPSIVNIALIDSEGIPISFAVKSRKYQIKPATLGSKSRALMFLSQNFAREIEITEPIIQMYFFEKIAVVLVNLKIMHFFLLVELKGWPLDGKLLYENFLRVKKLLEAIEDSKDDELKALFEDKSTSFTISDVTDNFLRIVAKNINSMKKFEISPEKVTADINPTPNDKESYENYLKSKLANNKILEGMCTTQDGTEICRLENTHKMFKQGMLNIIENTFKELDSFELGTPLWILNIFEKSEILLLNKLGGFNNKDLYSGLLMENRLGILSDILNTTYQIALDLKQVKSSDYLREFIANLEYIGFSVESLDIKTEKLKIKGLNEQIAPFMERAANVLENEGKIDEAGVYYNRLGKLLMEQGNNNLALRNFKYALKLNQKISDSAKIGDTYINLGKLAQNSDDIAQAMEHYKDAMKYYKKSGQKQKVKDATNQMNQVKGKVKSQVKGYISSSSGESLPLSFLEEKFEISNDILVEVLKELLESGELAGQVNLIKQRYTKKRFGSNEAVVGDTGIIGEGYELPEINRSSIAQQQQALERQLNKFEDHFEKINFPFEKYIEYQSKLLEMNFIEHKIKVYSSELKKNQCVICFKTFNNKDKIADCGKDHYYHLNCIKLWLENQSKCPVCNVDILDNFKVTFLDTLETKDDLISSNEIIEKLKYKINNLEKQLKDKSEQIYLMKEYSDKEKSIFEKLMVERDSKHLMEKELKKSNRLVQELRSLLEMIKK